MIIRWCTTHFQYRWRCRQDGVCDACEAGKDGSGLIDVESHALGSNQASTAQPSTSSGSVWRTNAVCTKACCILGQAPARERPRAKGKEEAEQEARKPH